MTYKGLEYDLNENEYIIIDNQWKALNYKGNKKVLLNGNLDLRGNRTITSLGNIVAVSGYVDLENSKAISLKNLEYVGGWADFYSSETTSTDKLKYIGGDAYFRNSRIKDWSYIEIKGEVHC